jgi:sarcosine oxidase, subunit gamma
VQPEATLCLLREAPPARRIGIKGKAAAALLESRGIAVPDRPNSWLPCGVDASDDGRLLRLGFGEYLLECDTVSAAPTPLRAALGAAPADAYLLLRDDRSFLLQGDAAATLLAEVCNVDFGALDPAARPVVLTLMAGVAVSVIREAAGSARAQSGFRIWCDPSFGHYLWSVLRGVVEAGGGSVQKIIGEHNEVPT